MRGLGNTHGVSINRLKEAFDEDWNTLVKEDTTTMAGDIFTKAFEQKDKWTHACRMINLFDMSDNETAPRIAGGTDKQRQQCESRPQQPREETHSWTYACDSCGKLQATCARPT